MTERAARPTLDAATAAVFARIALAGVTREYPHQLAHVLTSAGDVRAPRRLHPSFYGCYDWHSAVHTHWLLVRLWRAFPDLPQRPQIEQQLDLHLQPAPLAAEVAYAADTQRIAFERPYGWAWLFKLAQELHHAPGLPAAGWRDAVEPLAALFTSRLLKWLPRQQYPVRTGVHANTAFMLAFALDYARASGQTRLARAVSDTALRFYVADRSAPSTWEPSGNEFLSPSLVEADLMRRVLAPAAFRPWLEQWLPALDGSNLLRPVDVSDRGDPQGGHLDGLNLSRAWCLYGLASALDDQPARAAALRQAAAAHLDAGLRHVDSGDFLGEHWLATFAAYALFEVP